MTRRPRTVVLLVVDSLRASALGASCTHTPFMDGLGARTVSFARAYATECWTLPSHVSMFTGLLPSEHGAHFQTMSYRGSTPTVAEELAGLGFHTEVVTRNSIFDGSLPGVTRGFQTSTIPLSERGVGANPLALLLALSKPRMRRQIGSSGFFHQLQRENRAFVSRFTRAMLLPADVQALDHVLDRLVALRRAGRPGFLFCNLYDVHAPYSPSPRSMFRPWWPPAHWRENVVAPIALAKLGGHVYLRSGFRMRASTQRMLLDRYHRATELMDAKLAAFWERARALRLLDDTVVVLCSDHGEAFGDHGLYLHDASVYQTHLHVPLWIHDPDVPPGRVDDPVSLADLSGFVRAAARGAARSGTLLDPAYRAARPIVFAQHFHYPHLPDAAPRYRHDLMAAIGRNEKVIVRGEVVERYDLTRDPDERQALTVAADPFAGAWHGDVASDVARDAGDALRAWAARG